MKRLLFIAVAILLVSAVFSCSYQRVDEQLKTAYRLVNTRPDSSLSLLSHYEQKKMDRSTRAYYALVYTIAQDKSGLDVDNDSLLGYAYDYYRHRPDDSLYARCMYYMGKYYYLNDSTKQCLELLDKAHEAADVRGDLYTAYMSLNRMSIALQVSNPQKALSASQRAYSLFCQLDSTNLYNRVYLLMEIGNSYESCGRLDSSLYYMRQALQLANLSQNNELIGASCHSLSFALTKAGQPDSALYYSRLAFQKAEQKSTYLYMQLSRCYLDVDSLSQAENLARKILELTAKPSTRYAAYRRLLEIQLKKEGNQQAQLYADSTIAALSSLYYNVQNDNTSYQDDNLQLSQEKAETERYFNFYLYISICVFVALLTIAVSLWIVYNSHRRMSQKRLALEQERKQMLLDQQEFKYHQELLMKEQDHQHQMEMAKEKSRQEREKQRIRIESRDKQINLLKSYILLKSKELNAMKDRKSFKDMSADDWADIENYVNGMYSDFAVRFRESYPNLKEEDVRFCLLIKIGMTNTELQEFYIREMQTIKQRLLNLKPKLGISNLSISTREFLMDNIVHKLNGQKI